MKKFIIMFLCVLFMATSCKMLEPKPQEGAVKTLNVEDSYLTQKEMTELVTYVYVNGEKQEQIDRYSISAYEMELMEEEEVLVKASLMFIHNIQEDFYFADETKTTSPFLLLAVVNKPIWTEHKGDDGNVRAVQVDVDYEFYASFYNEEKDAYSVKPNKIFYKRITFEGYSGGIIDNKLTDTREDNPEGHDSDDWKVWMSMFYEKMKVDKMAVEEDEPSQP